MTTTSLIVITTSVRISLTGFTNGPVCHASANLTLGGATRRLSGTITRTAPCRPTNGARATAARNGGRDTNTCHRLLANISCVLPVIITNNLYVTLSFTFNVRTFGRPNALTTTLVRVNNNSTFTLVMPMLTNCVTFSVTSHPNLAPNLVNNVLTIDANSNFVNNVVTNFLTNCVTGLVDARLGLPRDVRTLGPVLVVPLVSDLIINLTVVCLVNGPITNVLRKLAR